MNEVFRHSDSALVGLYQSVLEDAGLPTFVRNSDTQQALVGSLVAAILPLPEFWPVLCVVDDDDYEEAMALLRSTPSSDSLPQPEWTCPQCGESVPPHFAVCWNCGRVSIPPELPKA